MRDFYANLSTGKWPVMTSPVCGATCHTHAIIIASQRIHTKDYLDTCVHETLHASNPEWDERTVARTANDVVEVLWKLGYRINKP